MPIDTTLVNEIEAKRKKILDNPNFYFYRANRIQSILEGATKVHSWLMEHPDVRMGLVNLSQDQKEIIIKKLREGVNNIREAWAFALKSGDVLTEYSILGIGAKVEPNKNFGTYRIDEVKLQNLSYNPPNPSKIRPLMAQIFYSLKDPKISCIERAAMAHLYITGIQPMIDGNKRTARIVQDKILYDHQLPPVFTPIGERAIYIDLLENALNDWKEGKSKGQRYFFDYIGGKVNNTLDQVIGDLAEFSRHRKGK